MKKLLVVVDYQNDFVDGALGFVGAEKLDEGIYEKVKEYIAHGDYIAYTMDTHLDDYLETREGKALPIPHCIIGTDGWQLYGNTGKLLSLTKNAIALQKYTFGVSPEIMADLTMHDIEEIEICGLVTNMCVISNVAVFQAKFPNAQITVDASLCDSFDKELHMETLHVLKGMQVNVIG